MRDELIKINDLIKVYGQEIKNEVLHGFSLAIKRGEFVSIIGPSGSGKSTLLNILGTLDTATSGQIIINDEDISDFDEMRLASFRNKNIGFVFQFHHLLPEFSAVENVMMPSWIEKGSAVDDFKERAYNLLDLVGLKGFEEKLITKLSGGQKQRVAVARALMNEPAILMADEPTGNLDSETTMKIYNLLRDINKELNTTFIIVTHDRHLAAKSDRVIEMIDGNIDRDIYKGEKGEDEEWQGLAPVYCRELNSVKVEN